MATRCNIMVTSDWKTFASAYCHLDGGLWGVGETLDKSYNDTKSILDLVALGAVSSLLDTVEETCTDDNNVHRNHFSAVEMKTEENVFESGAGEEYLYVWDANQEMWFVGTYYTKTPNWRNLSIALKEWQNKVEAKLIFGEDYRD